MKSKLTGAKMKRVVFLGDSITEGCCASSPQNAYYAIAARELGFEAVNMGKSGTRIARQSTPSKDASFDFDFNMRVGDMGAADTVVVFGGTNDFGHGDAPLGRFGDETEYTFCGACRRLLSTLCKKYKSKNVRVVLPLHRFDENCLHGDGSKKEIAPPLNDYSEALLKEARAQGIQVLDLRACDELNPNTKQGADNFYDGLHPNDSGHAVLAEKVKEFLQAGSEG